MLAVYKYPLANNYKRQAVELPEGAEIVAVAMQAGHPTLWARVDPHADKQWRVFNVVATGAVFEEGWVNVGTCFDGMFVWHVLEEPVGLLSADH